jgi:ribonuclease VapC
MSILLDSPALLARLLNEPRHALLNDAIASNAGMSSINLAEVMTLLVREGQSPSSAERALARLPISIHPFDETLALETGAMFAVTRKCGLSFGDRA